MNSVSNLTIDCEVWPIAAHTLIAADPRDYGKQLRVLSNRIFNRENPRLKMHAALHAELLEDSDEVVHVVHVRVETGNVWTLTLSRTSTKWRRPKMAATENRGIVPESLDE